MLALAQSLIDHPERTLSAVEIDAVIAQTPARQALAPSKSAARHGGRSPSALRRSPGKRDHGNKDARRQRA
jgi:hypothetical protein